MGHKLKGMVEVSTLPESIRRDIKEHAVANKLPLPAQLPVETVLHRYLQWQGIIGAKYESDICSIFEAGQ